MDKLILLHSCHSNTSNWQKIQIWFENNVKTEKANEDSETRRRVKSYFKEYTLRDALNHVYKDRIRVIIQTKPDAAPGSPNWMKEFSKAQSTLLNELDDDELEECHQLVAKWNNTSPDPEKQQQ